MRFLNPAAFYLLSVVPIVVALHFLKLRRRVHLVPSILFWLSTDEDRRANVPFQRLRNLLLPLLQVLFLLLLIASVARPALRSPGFLPGKAILIVDNSASMLATEMGTTRLSLAKQEAQDYVKAVSASGMIMLMTTNSAETIQHPFTTDRAKLQTAIADIAETHAPRNLRPVFDAATRYADSPEDRIVFISDTFENLPSVPLPVQRIGIGGQAENIGLVGFSVEGVNDRYEVLMRIQNFTDTPQTFEVQLAVESVSLDDKRVSIPANQTRSVLFSGDPKGLEGKVLRGSLDIEDDFWLDNRASAPLSVVRPLHILLVSDNSKSLLPELLRSYGDHVKLDVADPTDYQGTGAADVVFFDGGTLAGREAFGNFSEIGSGTQLVFIAPGNNLPFIEETYPTPKTETDPVHIIKVDTQHPFLAGISLQELQVRESMHRTLPLWGHPLVETEAGALIWLGTHANTRFLVFEFDAFNPEISGFALTIPAVPQFIYRCLAWLEAGTAPLQPVRSQGIGTRHAFRTGEPLRVTLVPDEQPFRVQKPDGARVELAGPLFTETNQVGVYTLFVADQSLERFTVNLLDATESALPYSETTTMIDTTSGTTDRLQQPMTREMWHWFAFGAFLLLILEWWFYHRSPV